MEVVALELIKQLQALDTHNQYVVFTKEDSDKDCLNESVNWSLQTVPGYTYADWEQIQLPIAAKKEKIDFLHCTCNTAPLYLSKPTLLTLHDIIYLEKLDFDGTSYQNFGNIYRRFVVPRVVHKASYVITVSEYERNTILERLHLPEEKVKVVYNAVNEKFNDRSDQEEIDNFRKKYRLPSDYLLFLGNTAPKKNTKNVVLAFASYCRLAKDRVPMVILDYEQMLVRELLISNDYGDCLDHFIFPGYINPSEMPLVYQAATLFLYPSLRESFGLPILEAMGCGVPVITSNTSSMPEVSGDAALLVDPEQPDQITEAMLSLLSDDELRNELCRRGKARAAAFTWEKAARQLLSIYNLMKP